MFKYVTVSTDSGEFKLNANLNEHDKFYMPSLTTSNGDDCECFSDNDTFLMETIYPYLKGDVEDGELDSYFKIEKEDLLAVFEEAIGVGFFDEYFNKNN